MATDASSLRAHTSAGPLPVWKKILFAGLVSVLFFTAVELILMLAGVKPIAPREDPSGGFSGLVSIFRREGDVFRTPHSSANWTFNDQSFQVRKPPRGLRLFCVGGSSSWGYPWGAEAAFTAILGDVLAETYPDRQVEAINTSGISYGMHRVRIVADEVLRYEPDILIIFSGHNEFIEPAFYGNQMRRSASQNRLEYVLAHTRIFSAIQKLLSTPNRDDENPQQLELLAIRDESATFSVAQKEHVVAEFRENLRHLVQAAQQRGVKTIVATVPCNLRWRPQRSLVEPPLEGFRRQQWTAALQAGMQAVERQSYTQAATELERASSLAPSHAETHYRLAQAYEGLEKWATARDAYQRACDEDASPQRRLTQINQAIRDVAAEEHAVLVDIDRFFQDASDHGVTGFQLIEDYVHPTLEGHQQIAWHLWQAIERESWLGRAAAADRQVFNHVVARRSENRAPSNARWFCNQAVVLVHQGQVDRAIDTLQQAASLFPEDANVHWRLASLLMSGNKLDEAIDAYQQALKVDPDTAGGWMNLGVVFERKGDLVQAQTHLRRALELEPGNAVAHYNLGVVLEKSRQWRDALAEFKTALQLEPGFTEAHARLADLVRRQRGESNRAVRPDEGR